MKDAIVRSERLNLLIRKNLQDLNHLQFLYAVATAGTGWERDFVGSGLGGGQDVASLVFDRVAVGYVTVADDGMFAADGEDCRTFEAVGGPRYIDSEISHAAQTFHRAGGP